MNMLLEAALQYAALGLAVIPLHGKRPYFENWTDIATVQTDKILKWWAQEPTANIGIATGAKSNVFVVDVDPAHGGEESIETLFHRHARFPETWEQVTGGGGRHYFFRYPTFTVGNRVAWMPGVDIRGDGGQVVAPPSIHPETHRRYTWDGFRGPVEGEPLAEAPAWLLDLLQPAAKDRKQPIEVPVKIPKGTQHATLVSMAGFMRRMGLTDEEIYPSLWAVNVARCEQPGPERNIRQIAHSMMRYQPGERNLYRESVKLWRLTRLHEEQSTPEAKPSSIDGYTLHGMNDSGPTEVIEGLLHNGVTVFAGRPKIGKSFLVLQLALCVAQGGSFAGWARVKAPGKTVYFALEEGPNRTSSRLKLLSPERGVCLQNIEFHHEIKPLACGGRDYLNTVLNASHPSLVVIDTLLALCRGSGGRRDVLRDDYAEIDTLSKLAKEHQTAIVVVHHLRKDHAGDPFDAVAGTTGVTAAADCIWTLQRQPEHRALLCVKGRELEENSLLLSLDVRGGTGWNVEESGQDAEMSEAARSILELLNDSGPMEPHRIAVELGKRGDAIRWVLKRLLENGKVVKNGTKYAPIQR